MPEEWRYIIMEKTKTPLLIAEYKTNKVKTTEASSSNSVLHLAQPDGVEFPGVFTLSECSSVCFLIRCAGHFCVYLNNNCSNIPF